MSKTSISLSSQIVEIRKTIDKDREKLSYLEEQFIELTNQHVQMVKMQRETASLQGEIANQILFQHEQIDQLLKSLGITKDLSEYSYNIFDGPAH